MKLASRWRLWLWLGLGLGLRRELWPVFRRGGSCGTFHAVANCCYCAVWQLPCASRFCCLVIATRPNNSQTAANNMRQQQAATQSANAPTELPPSVASCPLQVANDQLKISMYSMGCHVVCKRALRAHRLLARICCSCSCSMTGARRGNCNLQSLLLSIWCWLLAAQFAACTVELATSRQLLDAELGGLATV